MTVTVIDENGNKTVMEDKEFNLFQTRYKKMYFDNGWDSDKFEAKMASDGKKRATNKNSKKR